MASFPKQLPERDSAVSYQPATLPAAGGEGHSPEGVLGRAPEHLPELPICPQLLYFSLCVLIYATTISHSTALFS